MKIESSDIMMKSSYSYQKTEAQKESLEYWNGNIRVKMENATMEDFKEKQRELQRDRLNISAKAKDEFEKIKKGDNAEKTEDIDKCNKCDKIEMSEKDKQKLQILRKLLEVLTGKKIRCEELDTETEDSEEVENKSAKLKSETNQVEESPASTGWGIIYKNSSIITEKEAVGFRAKGVVKTVDGREILFKVDFNLKRELEHVESSEIRVGDAVKVDPLIINFNGNVSQLTDNKIEFDIDADGVKDFISFAGEGSGFLALDKNENGEIDDGTELFGPETGSGFGELKSYDLDGNNWIDENDEVFSKLKIWTTGENGEKTLLAIAEAGVGAIYLGSAATKFNMVNSDGSSNGELQRSGIFLKESGEAGLIQHIDLTK